MKLYIVYSRFCDDPSTVHGIFTSEEAANVAYTQWNNKYKELIEIESDEIIDRDLD